MNIYNDTTNSLKPQNSETQKPIWNTHLKTPLWKKPIWNINLKHSSETLIWNTNLKVGFKLVICNVKYYFSFLGLFNFYHLPIRWILSFYKLWIRRFYIFEFIRCWWFLIFIFDFGWYWWFIKLGPDILYSLLL